MTELPTADDLAVVEDCERALLTGAVRGDRMTAGLLLHHQGTSVSTEAGD